MKKDAIFTRGRKRSKDWPRWGKITRKSLILQRCQRIFWEFSSTVVHPISPFRIPYQKWAKRGSERFKTKPLTFICWPGVCRRSKCYYYRTPPLVFLCSAARSSAACCWRISVTLPWIIEVTWLLATTKGGGLINHMHCRFYTRPQITGEKRAERVTNWEVKWKRKQTASLTEGYGL